MATKGPLHPLHPDEAELAALALHGIQKHAGYIGMFTRRQAEGAIANGRRVEKVVSERGDTHPLGSRATVLGSVCLDGRIFYFLEWDASPRVAVGVVAEKIHLVDGPPATR
jgi:hypothetical protein